MSEELYMEVGEVKGRLLGMDKELKDIKSRQDAMDEKLDAILEKMNEAKGGWKAMSIMMSVAAALGALATKLLHIFLGVPK